MWDSLVLNEPGNQTLVEDGFNLSRSRMVNRVGRNVIGTLPGGTTRLKEAANETPHPPKSERKHPPRARTGRHRVRQSRRQGFGLGQVNRT